MSRRRNNIKILGLPEDKEKEKTRADTEEMVKKSINKHLDFAADEIQIKRAHRMGKPPRQQATDLLLPDSPHGSRKKQSW